MLLCHLHHLFKHFQITGDDQGRKFIAHQAVEHAGTLANVHAGQILHLALSENLQTFIVKIVIEAHQLQRGTKGIAHGNNSSVIICAFIEDLHVKGLDQFLQRSRCTFDFFHSNFSLPVTYSNTEYIIPQSPVFRNEISSVASQKFFQIFVK